jgi:hypothetical protein
MLFFSMEALLMPMHKANLLAIAVGAIMLSLLAIQNLSLANQLSIPPNSKFTKTVIVCENGVKYTVQAYSKVANDRRVEITKYPLKAILGCYGQYDLNNYSEVTAVTYTLESARKLMACARKKQAGILIANFPDYRAKARELSAQCVK